MRFHNFADYMGSSGLHINQLTHPSNTKGLIPEKMDQESRIQTLIEEVWNRGQLDLVDELIAPMYTIHHDPGDPWEGQSLDQAEFKERVQYSRNAFPNLAFAIQESVSGDDKVVISWYLSGKQDGDLAAIPATGKNINISGITIYYFKDGKITGHWQVIDQLAFLSQIGMFPNPGEG